MKTKRFKQLLTGLFALFSSISLAQDQAKEISAINSELNLQIRPDFQQFFTNCSGQGSIAIYDQQDKQWILSDSTAVHHAALPASTFKIINLLIALETKTIADEHAIVKWPGSIDTLKYGYRPNIYKDISVKEAFEKSAGWAFIELASQIDRNVYQDYLTACHYGNAAVAESDPDFWNFGGLAISPMDQVNLLKNLYTGNLPFSQRNIDIVKQVMQSEQEGSYKIHAKTGWTMVNNQNIGWWVGYLEGPDTVYFFATQLIQDRSLNRTDFGNCRKEITKNAFKALGILH